MSKSPKSLDIANLRYFLRYFLIFENLCLYISISYLFISIEPLPLIFISLLEEWEATESAHRLTLTRQTKPSGTYMDVCGLKGYLKNRSASFR